MLAIFPSFNAWETVSNSSASIRGKEKAENEQRGIEHKVDNRYDQHYHLIRKRATRNFLFLFFKVHW